MFLVGALFYFWLLFTTKLEKNILVADFANTLLFYMTFH